MWFILLAIILYGIFNSFSWHDDDPPSYTNDDWWDNNWGKWSVYKDDDDWNKW